MNRVEAFANAGFDVEMHVPTPTRGVTKEVRENYKRNKTKEMMFNNKVYVHRFPLYGEGQNPILRALRYALCCGMQLYYGLKAKNCDVIFAPSTPPIQGVMVAIIKKFKHIPFVYNLQDIFPDSLVGTSLAQKGGLLWKIGRVIENFTYKHADKIIVISEDFKKNIMAKGVPEGKIVVVYNWVDQNAVVDVSREENKLFDMYGLDRNKFYIEYSGNIGLTQNMDMLLEVMEGLQKSHPNIGLVLVGEGAYKTQVEKIVAEKQLKNVVRLPFQPYEDISHVFSLGDVGVIISKPGVGENSVPSKTWSIMSASRPVLANFDENEIKAILSENECGLFTKAGDKQAFTDAILELYRNREMCRKYGENGRKFVMENLTREIGTQKYIDVIKSVAKG
ncbi:glycosyltransferase family 4 protein [Bacteroides thetaiotaomicron]|uniref:glycosyltransferase family 4 protein n=2 Tax=Bacteroides thetaiotaomicron TaxID=818 RepID=UPI0032613E90